MKLIIAEKLSVAMEIAKVVGAVKREEGFVARAAGYLVSRCVGHLVSLAMSETNTEKIQAKREAIKKIEDSIAKKQAKMELERQKIKNPEQEIEELAVFDIKNFAKEANMPITELRSVLQDLLSESSKKDQGGNT